MRLFKRLVFKLWCFSKARLGNTLVANIAKSRLGDAIRMSQNQSNNSKTKFRNLWTIQTNKKRTQRRTENFDDKHLDKEVTSLRLLVVLINEVDDGNEKYSNQIIFWMDVWKENRRIDDLKSIR